MSLDDLMTAEAAWGYVSGGTEKIGGSRGFWVAKRLFDVVASLILLPVAILAALFLLALNPFLNRGPLIFVQKRMGHEARPFNAIKFRSMLPVEEITRRADDPIETHRITPLGEVLRKTRIDELPQIINVLRGEMSLIGPRPDNFDHASEYLQLIPEYRARHAILPGISGLAQVTLGYAEGIDATRAKASADLTYIRNAGFALDIKIIWLTLLTIVQRRGA